MIRIIDEIPDHKPHCGNCEYFEQNKDEESIGMCGLSYEPDVTPSWGWCPGWGERKSK